MNRPRTINWLLLSALLIGGCAPTSTGPATPTPTQASTTTPVAAGHMLHEAPHGGQLGMGETLHIEIVSERQGEYTIYLSDPSGNPLPLEGVTVEVALIDHAGNELLVLPARLSDDGQSFVAEGEPTDPSQADVRVKVMLPQNAELVEMDFTMQYQP